MGRSSGSRAHLASAERLAEAVAADDDAYVLATIQETLRRRPVIPNAAPRLVKKPVTVGGWDYPPDILLVASAYLVQHDPEIYPDPYEFRPERFLDEPPGTYTWIPFGGGRRRCLGASFAHARDEARAEGRVRSQRRRAGARRDGDAAPARDHDQPARGRDDRPARTSEPAARAKEAAAAAA